jgi:hypothetical protein
VNKEMRIVFNVLDIRLTGIAYASHSLEFGFITKAAYSHISKVTEPVVKFLCRLMQLHILN